MALNEQTKKQLKDFLQEENYVKADQIEHSHEEPKHNHATRSFDKFCPNCAEPNPDFKEPAFFCADCLEPIGTEEDLKNAKVCHNCGHEEAITKEEKEELQ